MRVRKYLLLLVWLGACLAASAVHAQVCDCGAALNKDKAVAATTQREKLHYLATMQANDFHLAKSNRTTSQGLGLDLSIPVIGKLGFAFDSTDDYATYDLQRHSILSDEGYSQDTELVTASSSQVTAPGALSAWVACQQTCSPGPFKAYIESQDARSVRIMLVNNTNSAVTVAATYLHGSPVSNQPLRIGPSSTAQLVVMRDANGAVDVDLRAQRWFEWGRTSGFPQTVSTALVSPPKELGTGTAYYQDAVRGEEMRPVHSSPDPRPSAFQAVGANVFIIPQSFSEKLTADSGFQLRNAQLRCSDIDRRPPSEGPEPTCDFKFAPTGRSANDFCKYNSERTEVTCEGFTNSRRVNLWVEAEEYRQTTTPSTWKPARTVTLIPGETFTFSIPANASGKRLEYRFGASVVTLEPGNSDNVLTLNGAPIQNGTDISYNYRVAR